MSTGTLAKELTQAQVNAFMLRKQHLTPDKKSRSVLEVISDLAGLQAANHYQSWTPRLLRAAYNYQYVSKDPGAFVRNPHYILQVLYDSLEDLGAEVSAVSRFDPVNSE